MFPFNLNKGDTIAIAATARKVTLAEIQPAITIFEQWGLTVKLADGLFETYHQFAGDDNKRVRSFQQLLDNDEVKAIVCARGGYGTVRIIDQLDFTHFSQRPKWIVGYSDITVLHSQLFKKFGIPSLHATMPINMQQHNADNESIESLRKVLFGEPISYSFSPHVLNRNGEAKGNLIGGNLSVLYSLLGSASDIDTKGCILFLEDLDEYLYHIDRMMINLKRNGKLKDLAGLIIGGMSDMKDNSIPFGKTAVEIIFEHVADCNYPIAFEFPLGHEKRNLAITLGEKYVLQVGNNCSIKKLQQID